MNARLWTAALVGALLGASLTAVFAQSMALDPPTAAPHIFETEFENDRVRVLRVNERPGETPPLHSLKDRLVAHVNSCAWTVDDEEGNRKMYSYRPGDIYWLTATTRGGKTSQVIQPCHTLVIEIKDRSAF